MRETGELSPSSLPSQLSPDAAEIGSRTLASLVSGERAKWVRRAQLLAGLSVAWHALEAAVAVLAGILASSIALVGFGADSVVESLAGLIVLWRFASARAASEAAERRAQQLIAVSFFLIAAYVGVEAIRNLTGGEIPQASWLGTSLALVTTVTMPLLARAKARVGDRLGGDQERGAAEHAVRLPLRGAACRLGRQRRVGLVVGRSPHGARHRWRRDQGGLGELEGRSMLRRWYDCAHPRTARAYTYGACLRG